jgi:hypothetical protein
VDKKQIATTLGVFWILWVFVSWLVRPSDPEFNRKVGKS